MKMDIKSYSIVIIKDEKVHNVQTFTESTSEEALKKAYMYLVQMFRSIPIPRKGSKFNHNDLMNGILATLFDSYEEDCRHPEKVLTIKWIDSETHKTFGIEVWKDGFTVL